MLGGHFCLFGLVWLVMFGGDVEIDRWWRGEEGSGLGLVLLDGLRGSVP